MPRLSPLAELTPRALRFAPLGLATLVLAGLTTRAVLHTTGGVPAVPLDDAYIHFQYARSIAELHPFRYTAGAAPTPGATSLLWPLLLSPFYALGARRESLVWVAWLIGWVSLAMLAHETRLLARGLVRPSVALAAGAMVLSFGGFTWFAASGMEVVPFAWLITRAARRAAEWIEAPDDRGSSAPSPPWPSRRELLVLAALAPAMRPEGALASWTIALALAMRPHGGKRIASLPAWLSPLLPSLVCFVATGQAVNSTAVAKWLPMNPYYPASRFVWAFLDNAGTLFGTLLDGRLWTSVFLPSGGRLVAWLALAAIVLAGVHTRRMPRALATLALALGMLLPATYETFLVNRVRYIWPFAPAWFVGLGALAELSGATLERVAIELGVAVDDVSPLLAGVVVGFFASRLGWSIDDLAESADAVRRQQVSLAHWAHAALPPNARLGVNDTGAMAYFSDRATFDVVGLTTAGEARYWTAGPGSRFEHYEHLPRERLPTHFIVYPEWFGIDALLGDELASRTVHATILGGTTMSAYRAKYDALGSAEKPFDAAVAGHREIDALDVCDIDSEAAHRYALFDAVQTNDVVVEDDGRADGARLERRLDRFELRLAPHGFVVARWGADETATEPVRVRVEVDGRSPTSVDVPDGPWHEFVIPVVDATPAVHEIRVRAVTGTFSSLHYWSFE